MLDSLSRNVGKINIRKLHTFTEAGLEFDEVRFAMEEMNELSACYDENAELK